MIGRGDIAAGGTPPADFDPARWIDWRDRKDRPVYTVRLWPSRSLTPDVRRAVLTFIGVGLALPLFPLFGTGAFWFLLPFMAGAGGLLWLGLRRSDFDGRLVEELTLWPDEMRVERREPGGRHLRWSAEPLRVRLRLRAEPVESYLTLKGGGREIELGAFLSPPERVALADEIETALGQAIRG